MPVKKKDAKKEAKAKKGGARRVKASIKVAKAAGKSFKRSTDVSKSARKRAKAAIRTKTRSQTAANLESTGKKQMASGKKKTTVKSQVVTPKSAHKEQLKKYGKAYGGMPKKWRKGLPKRKKK